MSKRRVWCSRCLSRYLMRKATEAEHESNGAWQRGETHAAAYLNRAANEQRALAIQLSRLAELPDVPEFVL